MKFQCATEKICLSLALAVCQTISGQSQLNHFLCDVLNGGLIFVWKLTTKFAQYFFFSYAFLIHLSPSERAFLVAVGTLIIYMVKFIKNMDS